MTVSTRCDRCSRQLARRSIDKWECAACELVYTDDYLCDGVCVQWEDLEGNFFGPPEHK